MKLEGAQQEALIRLARFFDEKKVPFAVIGALAPVLMIDVMHEHHGSYGSRITKDVDVSIRVAGWDEYAALKHDLIRIGFSEKSDSPEHRMFYGDVDVDILPYGGGLVRDDILVWPKSGKRMSMWGFESVFQAAKPVQIEKGFSIPVIPVPLSILLKIHTWLDRRESRDLEDIVYMLDQYETVEVGERRFQVLEAGTLPYDFAGAYLAGMDLRALDIPQTMGKIQPFFDLFPNEDAALLFSVSARISRKPEDIFQLILFFRKGLSGDV